jgi:peptidylprolyl isomerase
MNRFSALVALAAILFGLACQRLPQAATPVGSSSDPASSSSTSMQDRELGPMLPGVEHEDILVGSGAPAQRGDRVSVHYVGRLADGTQFDSSLDRGSPLEFVIGAHQVIEGWDIGVVGMQKGGKRKLKVPPHLAYGLTGSPPTIPPDATLLFDIELLEIR